MNILSRKYKFDCTFISKFRKMIYNVFGRVLSYMDESKKRSLHQVFLQAIPLVFLFFGMFGAFKVFEYHNALDLQKQNEAYLIECTEQLKNQLDRDIQNYSDTIKSISYLFSELTSNFTNGPDILREIEKKTQFDALYFVSKYNGKVYSSAGEVIDYNGNDIDASESVYYDEAMSGDYGVGVMYPSKITGKRIIGYYAPVTENEAVVGVLVGCIEEESIKKELATYFYGTLSDTLLISENLKIIGVSSRISIRDYIDDDDDPYDFKSIAKIQLSTKENEEIVFNALAVHQEAPFKYRGPYGISLGYVKKLDTLDWMIIQTFPADAIQTLAATAERGGKILEAILIGLFTIYIIHLISMNFHKRKIIQKQLVEQTVKALMDELTGVYNRRAFEEDIEEYKNIGLPKNLTFIEIDINGLKTANDSAGHKAGDELIMGTAQCLKNTFLDSGKVYRLGGDEFGVIMNASKDEIEKAVEYFRGSLKNWHGRYNSELTVSIGVAHLNEYPNKTIDELKTQADVLMYADKDMYYKLSGKNRRTH